MYIRTEGAWSKLKIARLCQIVYTVNPVIKVRTFQISKGQNADLIIGWTLLTGGP